MTNPIDLIMEFEQGQLDANGIIDLFASLIQSGMAYQLQGSYGRMANALIDKGYISRYGEVLEYV